MHTIHYQHFIVNIKNDFSGIMENQFPTNLLIKLLFYASDRSGCRRTQRGDIVINFSGELDLPDNPQARKEQGKNGIAQWTMPYPKKLLPYCLLFLYFLCFTSSIEGYYKTASTFFMIISLSPSLTCSSSK